jgi:hypothetical protein
VIRIIGIFCKLVFIGYILSSLTQKEERLPSGKRDLLFQEEGEERMTQIFHQRMSQAYLRHIKCLPSQPDSSYAIMQMASCSIRYNPASLAFYQRKTKEGKGHWQAVKCLARNMLRVIYTMLKNKTMYQLDFKNQEMKLAEAA